MPELIEIHYRECPDCTVRIWRTGWAGDQFEILSAIDFGNFKNIAERLGFVFVDHTTED